MKRGRGDKDNVVIGGTTLPRPGDGSAVASSTRASLKLVELDEADEGTMRYRYGTARPVVPLVKTSSATRSSSSGGREGVCPSRRRTTEPMSSNAAIGTMDCSV